MRAYEPWFTEWLHAAVTEKTIFVDVGASLGHYVLVAACAKEIVAIEPQSDYREEMRENIQREGLTNVTIVEKPLFSKVLRGDIVGAGRHFYAAPGGAMETTTLDALNLAPDIIKIDVEGVEYDIVVGGIKTLLQYRPVLLVEVHPKQLPRYGHRTEHLYHLIVALGYKIIEGEKCAERQWIRAEVAT